jgi:hypothetical protein
MSEKPSDKRDPLDQVVGDINPGGRTRRPSKIDPLDQVVGDINPGGRTRRPSKIDPLNQVVGDINPGGRTRRPSKIDPLNQVVGDINPGGRTRRPSKIDPLNQVVGDINPDPFGGVGEPVKPGDDPFNPQNRQNRPQRARYKPRPSSSRTRYKPQPNQLISENSDAVSSMSLEQKLIKAMELAVNSGKLSKELQQQLRQLLTPDNLKILAGIIAIWGAGHLCGYGQAADAVLAGLGILGLGLESVKAAQALWGFFSEAQNARSLAGLQKSAEHFAEFVSIVGTNALFVFIGKNASKAVDGLSGVLTKAGRKLNEITPAVRKLAKEALEASSNLLKNAENSIRGSLRNLRDFWKDLFGGKPQPVPASGGNLPQNKPNQPMQSRGRGSGVERHSYQSRLLEGIETKPKGWGTIKNTKTGERSITGKKEAETVTKSLDAIESNGKFSVQNSKGQPVSQKFGSVRTNNAAKKLQSLAVEILPNLEKEIDALQSLLSSSGSLSKFKDPSAFKDSINAIRNHLKPSDLIGALRDVLGTPVVIGGKAYDHAREVKEAIKSLTKLREELEGLLRHQNLARKKGDPNFQYKTQIEDTIRRIKDIERKSTEFLDPKSYTQELSQNKQNQLGSITIALANNSMNGARYSGESSRQLNPALYKALAFSQELSGGWNQYQTDTASLPRVTDSALAAAQKSDPLPSSSQPVKQIGGYEIG